MESRCAASFGAIVCCTFCSTGLVFDEVMPPKTRCTRRRSWPERSIANDPAAPTFANTIEAMERDRKSTRLNSSHANISYAVFCLKKKKKKTYQALLRS